MSAAATARWREPEPAGARLFQVRQFGIDSINALLAGMGLNAVEFTHIILQFHSRVHSFERFARGRMIFMACFYKKLLIADSVAPLADA